jgi:hypothetical protein
MTQFCAVLVWMADRRACSRCHDTLHKRRDVTADVDAVSALLSLNLDMKEAPAAHFCPLFAHEARARLG